jgi:hypothetical protein
MTGSSEGWRTMSILDFVSQEELDDLDEDPQIAFMTFVGYAQKRLAEQRAALNPQDEVQWHEREELAPQREFQSELDHYIAQLVIDRSIRAKRDSVAILPDTKDRIRTMCAAFANASITQI